MAVASCYDVCVVGAGTIGAAAAHHLTLAAPSTRILLIGPLQQKSRPDSDIHGAHYDEGRITRPVDMNPIWATLGSRSIERYRQFELQSGVKFFEEVGFLCIATENGKGLHDMDKSCTNCHIPYKHLSKEKTSSLFPYFHPRSKDAGIYIERKAGYINIRKMITAHRKLAHRSGCNIVDDIVKTITPPSGDEDCYRLETDTGRVFYSRKVLLATGAFTNCRNLLPDDVVPDIDMQSETVILIEIDEDKAGRFSGMPSIVVYGPNQQSSVDAPHSAGLQAYILPPIRYPDGKTYLKIGHGKIGMDPIRTPEDINTWYNRKDTGPAEEFVYQLARTFFPDIPMQKYKYEHCVTAHTPHGFPFIDMLTPSLGVVLAGNGRGAKCADELGRIAARMILKGSWDSDLPKGNFRLINKGHVKLSSQL